MAYFFWKQGNDDKSSGKKEANDEDKLKHPHIIMALMASSMLSQLAQKAHDRKEPDLHESLSDHASLFEVRASDVLMECSADDRHKTQDLLTREHSRTIWGDGTTLLSAAYIGERKHFLERIPCRVNLDSIWRGKMVWSTPLWKVFLTAICPFFVFWIKFTDNQEPADVMGRMLGCTRAAKVSPQKQESGSSKKKEGLLQSSTREKKVYIVSAKSSDDDDTVHFMSALLYFYSAPVTKFYGCTFSYLVFLGLFSYTSLTDLHPRSPSFLEYIVWVWIFLFLIEESRQIWDSSTGNASHFQNVRIWMNDTWNIFDGVLYFGISPLCLILRLAIRDEEYFNYARNAFAITLACFFFRFLQTYYAFHEVGSKVVMIFHMMKDLFKFGLILLVFIVSYGVAITVILYPNRPMSLDQVRNVLYSPYWQIFVRDAFVDSIDGADDGPICSENRLNPSCRVDNKFGDALLVLYTMFTNVLLLNVLIAMFNSTFERFHKDSTTWWHYNRYSLVYEYVHRPTLAPPLIIFSYMRRIVRWINRCSACGCECYQEPSAMCVSLKDRRQSDDDLTEFERINMEKQMGRQENMRAGLEEAGITPEQRWKTDGEDGMRDDLKKAIMYLETITFKLQNPAQVARDGAAERLENVMANLEERYGLGDNQYVNAYEQQLREQDSEDDSACWNGCKISVKGRLKQHPLNIPRLHFDQNATVLYQD